MTDRNYRTLQETRLQPRSSFLQKVRNLFSRQQHPLLKRALERAAASRLVRVGGNCAEGGLQCVEVTAIHLKRIAINKDFKGANVPSGSGWAGDRERIKGFHRHEAGSANNRWRTNDGADAGKESPSSKRACERLNHVARSKNPTHSKQEWPR